MQCPEQQGGILLEAPWLLLLLPGADRERLTRVCVCALHGPEARASGPLQSPTLRAAGPSASARPEEVTLSRDGCPGALPLELLSLPVLSTGAF